jgi:radical SAM superfamily enzyme YgiQ (UPF0313 family)
VLGAAELLWPRLIELAISLPRDRLLGELAGRDGYFVPRLHLDAAGRPARRLRRIEKRDRQISDPSLTPASWAVTPHTEYSGRGLVEISRGCPEKCRYCWVGHSYGRLRCYPGESVMERVRRLREITDRVGFVATAVGNHPELPTILDESRSLGMNVALSSLRIPAMVPEVLGPLARCGARSVTIAPETGSDRLRQRLNKSTSNASILEAVETAQQCGIESLKMYFIIGLPGETDDDLEAIGELVRRTLAVLRNHGARRGRMGRLHAGFSLLVPKPYTPYSRVPMLPRSEAARRIALVHRGIEGLPNLRIDRPSYREAIWQGCLSRGDVRLTDALEALADGDSLSQTLRRSAAMVEELALSEVTGSPVWQFVSSAPSAESKTDSRGQRPIRVRSSAGAGSAGPGPLGT